MRNKKDASAKTVLQMLTGTACMAMYGKPTLQIACDGHVIVENCKAILQYNSAHIRFDMGDNSVQIEGDGLIMDTFQKHYITVHGRIFSIKFYYGEAGKC